MANCRGCGLKVGCGCQLINGLCSACNNAAKKAAQDKMDKEKEQEMKASTISEEVKASEEVAQVPTTQEVVEQAVPQTSPNVVVPPDPRVSTAESPAKATLVTGTSSW